MKLSREERQRNRQAFRSMSIAEQADYIFTYYKPALVAIALAVVAAVSLLSRLGIKPPELYVGLINVNVGSELTQTLEQDGRVLLYEGWYLTDDPDSIFYQYVYASRMKLMASIESQELDVVLVNQEGYDALSQSGYLADLSSLIPGDSPLTSRLTSNLVILEDNAQEHALDESIPYEAVTDTVQNGIRCDGAPLFQQAGLDGAVYLVVIANTPRTAHALDYCAMLCLAE